MISVAMATYNGEKYLEKQLDSIFSQTCPIDELVVCDDGSKDKTVSILKRYQERYPIRIYSNEKNLGYKLNFKKALSLCKGDHIFLCDQDDIWLEEKVEIMMDKMQEDPRILVLASSFVYINAQDQLVSFKEEKGKSNNNLYLKPVKKEDCVEVKFEEFYHHNFFQGCALLIKKEIRDEVVNHFTEKIPHDHLINLMAAKEGGMYFWNHVLFQYRLHENNAIGVIDKGQGILERMRNRNTYYIRSLVAQDGLNVLEALKESDPNFYLLHEKEYDAKRIFYKKHLKDLKERNFFSILFSNLDPIYRQLKHRKARVMDLLYAILG